MRARGVLHPLWWTALAVLLVNDHVLKGAGVLPGWLTGKLSDFAWLLVAPVCLVTLLGLRRPAGRAVAFALVAAAFTALELWPGAVPIVEAAGALLGRTWRTWPDPTDLLALPMLAVAWRLVSPSPAPTPRSGVTRSRLSKAAAIVGGLACVATSGYEPITTAAYLVNTTHDDLAYDLYRAPRPLDCESIERDSGFHLPGFEFDQRGAASPFLPIKLDRDLSREAGPYNVVCDAVLLTGPGFPDVVLFWYDANRRVVQQYSVMDQAPDPNAVYIERVGDELLFSGDAVRVYPVE